jgi:ABC-type nitrate/sulfonate/bicarbonate transport system substrate-binding protein
VLLLKLTFVVDSDYYLNTTYNSSSSGKSIPSKRPEEGEGMNKKRIVLLAAGAMIILPVLVFFFVTKLSVPEKAEKVTMGVRNSPVCALVYIAQQQNRFKRHGVDLSIENYQAGVYAVNDLLSGKVDVVTAAETVLALQAFQNEDLRAIATISSTNNTEVVARKDRGIAKPEDLRRKRIGIVKGNVTEFFLHAFLSFHGIHSGEIQAVDLKPTEMVTAITEGKIDAASCFPPFLDTIKKNLGQNGVSWSAQGGQDYYVILLTRADLIKTRPWVIDGLLKGMIEAEDFLKKDENEAQAIVESALGVDRETVLNTWAKTRFRVRLDQSLLTLLEDEGRWAIHNKLVDGQKNPNYLNFFYLDGLGKIKPDSVTVIR